MGLNRQHPAALLSLLPNHHSTLNRTRPVAGSDAAFNAHAKLRAFPCADPPMRLLLLLLSCCLLTTGSALAQTTNPRVLFDTDRGPMLLELDSMRAPITVTNFMRYVDDGRYNDILIYRVARNFVIQGGGFKSDSSPVPSFGNINSERNNGLSNTVGTIAVALPGNPPMINSGSNEWFINTGNNSATLNANFTVFGRVVFGMKTMTTINNLPVFSGTEQPIRIPLIKRAVRVAAGQFPILPLHTGSWFDPANPGKGFILEVAQASGSEQGPLLVLSWYDFHEGKQIWMYGSAPFALGASSVEVPLQISTGGQFGSAFMPGQVTANPNWGKVTVRFTGCDAGNWSYTSIYGNGNFPVRSLTLPTDQSCVGN